MRKGLKTVFVLTEFYGKEAVMEKGIVVMLVVIFCLGLGISFGTAFGDTPICNAGDGVAGITMSAIYAGNFTPGDAKGFPLTISKPGSYRLCENITVPNANTTAILVQADNVTIDLNGFAIFGPTVCTGSPVTSCAPTGTGNGIDATGHNNIKVKNGTIKGIGNAGIIAITNCIIQGVRAISNGGGGIYVGYNGIVKGNIASNNGGNDGIGALSGTVSGNAVNYNHGGGITVSFEGTVSGNTVNNNAGFYGIYVSNGTVSGNTANGNYGVGINATENGTIIGNTAVGNGVSGGISVANGLVSGNTAIDNTGHGLILAGTAAGYFNNVLGNNVKGNVSIVLRQGTYEKALIPEHMNSPTDLEC